LERFNTFLIALNNKILKGKFSLKLNKKWDSQGILVDKDKKILSLIEPINLKKNLLELDLNNSWLSGFIDAEGCFFCYFRLKSTNKYGYNLGFDISQKYIENKIILETPLGVWF
jgi:hypothetical protein